MTYQKSPSQAITYNHYICSVMIWNRMGKAIEI